MKYLGDISLSSDNLSQRGREIFLLQSLKTPETPYSYWWSTAGLAGCSCKTSSIFSLFLPHRSRNHCCMGPGPDPCARNTVGLKHSSQYFEDPARASIFCNVPKTTQQSSFSVLCTNGHCRTAPAHTQPSWVVVSYIHGRVPQEADQLPLLGESPSHSRTVGQTQRTGDSRIKGTGHWSNTASTLTGQRRCIFSILAFLFTEVLGLLLT